MKPAVQIIFSTFTAWIFCACLAQAEGVLDGRVFMGMIGPEENPDLEDSLHFSDGHFWSDICTRCGFVPGRYVSEGTDDGVRLSGVLESDDRGHFKYDGLVRDNGAITVSIRWERKRWYWTSSRDITFRGSQTPSADPSLAEARSEMQGFDPTENPLCARF
ncbi:hypothetical protein AB2B41_16705 [Marimonas sp. MJW-29]|uniref:DUF2147 domain-containing protein n=1 Tax=Sulfitobacter sediminis TaxID=3234186 RepID=A0ABV3RQV1_9RHOB